MSPKSFPAANAAMIALTVLTLSLPAVNARGAAQAARREARPAPAAARPEASLWQWVVNLFLPDSDGQPPPVHGNSGCEMDPDGVVHNPPPPKPCV